MRLVRRLSIAALVVACLHLVFGAIVRISGSELTSGGHSLTAQYGFVSGYLK